MAEFPQKPGKTDADEQNYRPLAELCGEPMEPGRFLELAISITAALAALHQQNITHENLTPFTIHIDTAGVAVHLTASAPRSHDLALPYISPEQTGRLNLAVDHRSDLYSLGVIFYEMLTGALPCEAQDLLEWVHCHIAHPPRPLRELVSEVPSPIADIVMKLLAKNAQERYQTAAGLQWDLQKCLRQWQVEGKIKRFVLGERDISARLLIPQKLYGRDHDLALLMEGFSQVVESGRPRLFLVAGYSGIGKSALVRQLCQPVVRHRGYFISGKFDQYLRNMPYSTIAQAFRELIRQLLSESEERIAQWKRDIEAALGLNGQLLVDIIPELEYLVGRQPPVQPLPAEEALSRFNMFFQRFVAVFARAEHPLVIFLDDLQWPDPGSLRLVSHIVAHPDTHHLLVIGAYRDNEVSPPHPLLVAFAELERGGEIIRTIKLAPLSPEDLGHLIADTFRSEESRVEQLTWLVHEKTGGNPFFAVQFLKSLYEEGLVRFDYDKRLWTWEIEAIRDKGYTDNVADLMVAKLKKLPERVLQEMRLAACIGNRFEFRTLAMISGISAQEVRESLDLAVAEGLLLHLDGSWLFLHDRIQEAAYSLVPEGDRAGLHLGIGRLLLSHLPASELEERVLDVVNQLNKGEGLITSGEERDRVAELNLLAAQRAKGTAAYHSALHYLGAGGRLLSEDAWQRRHRLAFSIELLQAECEFLTGELEQAKERLTELMARNLDLVDGSAVACLLIDLLTTKEGRDPAVAAGLSYLRRVGVEWQAHPDAETVGREFDPLWQALRQRPREELMDLPLMTDPEWRAVMDVLSKLLPPTLHTDGNLFSLVVCRMVELSLQHGNSDGSCLAYVWLGLLSGPRFGDYAAACHFGKVGLDLVDKRGLDRYKARVYLDAAHAALLWEEPMRKGPDLMRRALEVAEERGDLTFMAYASCNLISALLSAGRPLAKVQEEAEKRLAFAGRARFGMVADIIAGQLELIRLLRGLTPAFATFNEPGFDEARFERHLDEDPGMAGARSWYWARKLQACFYTGDFPAALHAADKTREVLWTIPSHLESAEYEFFGALTCCACYAAAPPPDRPRLLESVQRHLAQLREWEKVYPQNFDDRTALVSAELARLQGQELKAELLYEEALLMARKNALPQNEALVFELASRFYQERGFQPFADFYLRQAIARYRGWGADGKVRQLERQVPARGAFGNGAFIGQVDAITVVKASQAISQEILLSELLNTLMRMAVKNAGAQKGCLLLVEGDELSVAAQAALAGERIEVQLEPATPLPELLPVSMAHYVRRTREKVILADAHDPNPFSADGYLERHQPVSVLCLPVSRQAATVGILYLENNVVKGAFTGGMVAVLEALAAQAAISLENSRLYTALRESELKYRELSENLEVRVQEAVKEVGEKNRLLVMQSRQAIMGEMLGNIAHQWRQPLNSLALLAQELQMNSKFKTLTDELLDGNVKKTMEIIRHMSKTIDDFRYFFKPEKEKVNFRLLEVLEKALSLLEGTFHAYGITVETVTTGDPVLSGYPNEYSQVLLNILNNAKDALLSREITEPKITITVGSEGEKGVVTIADNAGGIPEGIIEKIFDLYFTTKGPEHGTGVGLFMSKSIIEKNMGGSLTVHNTKEGAEFRIEV